MEIKTTNEQIEFIESLCNFTGESVLVYLVHNDLEITEENILDITYDNLENIFDDYDEEDYIDNQVNDYVYSIKCNFRKSDFSFLENYVEFDDFAREESAAAILEDYFSKIYIYEVCNINKDICNTYKYCEE